MKFSPNIKLVLLTLSTVLCLYTNASAASIDLSNFDPSSETANTSLEIAGGTLEFNLGTNTATYSIKIKGQTQVTQVGGLTILDSSGTTYSSFVFDDLNIGSGTTIEIIHDTTNGLPTQGLAILSKGSITINSDISYQSSHGGNIALIAEDTINLGATLDVSGTDGSKSMPNAGSAGSVTLAASTIQAQNGTVLAAGGDGRTQGNDNGTGGDGGDIYFNGNPLSNLPSTDTSAGTGSNTPSNGIVYSNPAPGNLNPIAVPEPSSSSMLALAACTLLMRRTRKH